MSNKKNYLIIFLIVATELIGFGLIIPILPQISQQYTQSGLLLGILISSFSFTQFFAAPILGKLSDQYGRKPILILSKFGTAISYLILAHSGSYWMLLISRCLDGFTGGNIAVARAYLSDITPAKNRSKAMAIIGIAFGTGFIFGPAIGGICYAISNNFSIAGWVGFLLSTLSMIITMSFLKEPEHKQSVQKTSTLQQLKKLSPYTHYLLVFTFIGMFVFSGFESSFSVFTEFKFGLTPQENSHLFLIIGIIAFFIQGSFTRISIKPFKKAILIALGCISVGLVLPIFSNHILISLAPLCLLIFGIAILNTHIPAELSQHESKGFILGIYESINSMARILGPLLIFSILYSKISILYLVLGGIAGLTFIITLIRFNSLKL